MSEKLIERRVLKQMAGELALKWISDTRRFSSGPKFCGYLRITNPDIGEGQWLEESRRLLENSLEQIMESLSVDITDRPVPGGYCGITPVEKIKIAGVMMVFERALASERMGTLPYCFWNRKKQVSFRFIDAEDNLYNAYLQNTWADPVGQKVRELSDQGKVFLTVEDASEILSGFKVRAAIHRAAGEDDLQSRVSVVDSATIGKTVAMATLHLREGYFSNRLCPEDEPMAGPDLRGILKDARERRDATLRGEVLSVEDVVDAADRML